eukprot:4784019-Pleurochrysis_carterae.AAC.6
MPSLLARASPTDASACVRAMPLSAIELSWSPSKLSAPLPPTAVTKQTSIPGIPPLPPIPPSRSASFLASKTPVAPAAAPLAAPAAAPPHAVLATALPGAPLSVLAAPATYDAAGPTHAAVDAAEAAAAKAEKASSAADCECSSFGVAASKTTAFVKAVGTAPELLGGAARAVAEASLGAVTAASAKAVAAASAAAVATAAAMEATAHAAAARVTGSTVSDEDRTSLATVAERTDRELLKKRPSAMLSKELGDDGEARPTRSRGKLPRAASQHTAPHYTSLLCTALCSALHCTTPHLPVLPGTALHCTARRASSRTHGTVLGGTEERFQLDRLSLEESPCTVACVTCARCRRTPISRALWWAPTRATAVSRATRRVPAFNRESVRRPVQLSRPCCVRLCSRHWPDSSKPLRVRGRRRDRWIRSIRTARWSCILRSAAPAPRSSLCLMATAATATPSRRQRSHARRHGGALRGEHALRCVAPPTPIAFMHSYIS